MIEYLNKHFPKQNYPSIIVHVYYFLISFTFCYLYYHKFVVSADFYSPNSSSGIFTVANLEALKPIQFRILIPFIFKALKSISAVAINMPDKVLFFIIIVILCYSILLSFYFLLNEYFSSKAINCWLAAIIIYPMIWNFVIMNGQFFFMDFSVLLIIILGFYAIVSYRFNWLLIIFFLGVLNHPSVGYLIVAFLLFNYRKLLKVKIILYTCLMSALYVATYKIMDYVFPKTEGYFIIYNFPRNLNILNLIPLHIFIRDLLLNFGGLHFILLLFLLSGLWKQYKGPMLYVNLVILPYVVSVMINFSIEEIRNYIAIIPFILITSLLFLSTFPNSFLKPIDRVLTGRDKN